ncbi:MAG: hypothetical protein AAF387_05820 [Pseudomonadota bacterium]
MRIPPANLKLLVCFTALLFCCSSSVAFGCDSDAECGAGGTCVKREKRARGVCFGGGKTDQQNHSEPPSKQLTETPPTEPSLSPSGDAPIFGEEGYVEPSAPPRLIDRLDIQDADSSACIATSDCGGGQECVYRDPMLGHGTCEAPPS